jgi:succinate dehydrogenase / fumarate reductase flavoprotein subunit
MSESLRNSGRIWVPKKLKIQLPSEKERKTKRYKEEDRDYYLERRYPILVT